MAISVTLKKVYSVGDRKEVTADIALDSSYPTGGYSLVGSDLGLELEFNFLRERSVDPAGSRLYSYDAPNSKLKVFTAVGTEASNASDQSAFTVRVHAVGKGKAAA